MKLRSQASIQLGNGHNGALGAKNNLTVKKGGWYRLYFLNIFNKLGAGLKMFL